MSNFGVFINYRRKDKFFAGLIYDHLMNKGFEPFMDVFSLKQGNYHKELQNVIAETPFFLMVLTGKSFTDGDAENYESVYYNEIEQAIKT